MQCRCAHRLLLLLLLPLPPLLLPLPALFLRCRQQSNALGVAQTFPQHLLLLHRQLRRRQHCWLRSQHRNGPRLRQAATLYHCLRLLTSCRRADRHC